MKLYILYKTDFNHSHSSKEQIGFYTNTQKLRQDCLEIITKDIQSDSGNMDKEEENNKIKYDFSFLIEHKQTQGLNNFELMIEEESLNEYEKLIIDRECNIGK